MINHFRGLFLLLLLKTAFFSKVEAKTRSVPQDIRLPQNISPLVYSIELTPLLEKGSIDGKESIEIVCSEDTNKIYLHLKEITINEQSVSVRSLGGEGFPIAKHEYDLPRDFYIINLEKNLQAGSKYILTLGFTSKLTDGLVGFYRGTYIDKDTNEKKWYAATQFEATEARKAFPCFDEPSMKSEFKISLGRLEKMITISNMPLNSTAPIDNKPGYFFDHYEKSVPMSTYLIAFIVSDFVYLKSEPILGKTEFRVWARKELINQAEYTKKIGPPILAFFEEYFKIDFPLPKQDMVALPDFIAGGMENWGLVTYRESTMLLDPKVSSLAAKKHVASVVSHELSHQWFGNLVTMKWWSQLWLNEGFAKYAEYLGVEKVQPEMQLLNEFCVKQIQDVMRLDALESSHPISTEVVHPDDIGQLFDAITYKKGASVIRMMNHFLTEATFREGLANYLRDWKYKNTIQDDLWQSFTNQAHADGTLSKTMTVKEIMDSWTLQKGFPVVFVDRNYDSNTATFTQNKFKLISSNNAGDSTLWRTPISYASKSYNSDFSETKPSFWLIEKSATKDIPAKANEWFIVNPKQTGFYRVNYDKKNWKLIQKQLLEDYRAIPIINRAQILDDALSLAQGSLLSYSDALAITEYIGKDNEYIPWAAFKASSSFINDRLKGTNLFGTYKDYVRSLVNDQYKKIGFFEKSGESLPQIEHRTNIIAIACGVDHPECVDQAKTLFTSWKQNKTADNPIPKDIRFSAYCTVIRLGSEEDWEFLWNKYRETNVGNEKDLILTALGCTSESGLTNRYLDMAMNPNSGIRKQDSASVFQTLAAEKVGSELVLKFLIDKWQDIITYHGSGGLKNFGSVFTALSKQFNSKSDLLKLEEFQKKHEDNLGEVSMSLKQAKERAEANVKWQENNFGTVSSFLRNKVKGNSTLTTQPKCCPTMSIFNRLALYRKSFWGRMLGMK